MDKFLELMVTDAVRAAEQHYYGRVLKIGESFSDDTLTEDEIGFIQSRDSFYLSTVSENDWPYVQHRGGNPGFLRVLSPKQLAFADYKGNRQLISTGNISQNDRVCLFLMDYPRRTRLKLLGHARIEDARDHPELVAQLAEPEAQRVVERLFFIDVVSFDWNCQQYITPRYTQEQISGVLARLQQRIEELEARVKE